MHGQHGADDLDLVAHALREGGAQRTVDEPRGEDGLGAGAALAAEERAGDPARRVGPLLDVDGQGEEVEVLLGRLRRRRGGEDGGLLVEVGQRRAVRLAGQQPGLEANGPLAEAPVVDDGL